MNPSDIDPLQRYVVNIMLRPVSRAIIEHNPHKISREFPARPQRTPVVVVNPVAGEPDKFYVREDYLTYINNPSVMDFIHSRNLEVGTKHRYHIVSAEDFLEWMPTSA